MKLSLLTILFCVSLTVYCQQTAEPGTGARLQYVLLNDASERTLWPGGIEQQVNTATQFLRQVVTPGSDVGSLVNFNVEPSLDVENSTDPDSIVAKLARQGHEGSGLYGAVISSIRWVSKQESSDRRKMVFVFSDGEDNSSPVNLQGAIAAVQGMHIPVYVVAPSVVEHKRQGKALKQLAKATGGQAYFVHKGDRFDFALLKRDLAR